jgi:hypothetical protein
LKAEPCEYLKHVQKLLALAVETVLAADAVDLAAVETVVDVADSVAVETVADTATIAADATKQPARF